MSSKFGIFYNNIYTYGVNNEIIRFLSIGLLNTFIGYILFSIVYFISNSFITSLLISYILGILFNYNTYSKYVFTNANKQIFKSFIVIYISIFLFNNFILYILHDINQVNTYISQLIAIVIVTPILYILNKKYVFIEDRVL